jgi:hypothetical protein
LPLFQALFQALFSPSAVSLAGLAAVFAFFLLGDDPEKWQWRAYLWSVIAVNLLFGVFGPWGYLFGVAGTLLAPWFYFVTFQNRRYVLRDMLLFTLLLGCMCTQIASNMHQTGAGLSLGSGLK